VHLAAYALWRLGWIHPFHDGNGRTARALAYAVLRIASQRAKWDLLLAEMKQATLPDLIALSVLRESQAFYDALRKADEAWLRGDVDVSALEELLAGIIV
jgi:fido (protein-threonine AMPylation protein)